MDTKRATQCRGSSSPAEAGAADVREMEPVAEICDSEHPNHHAFFFI
jgi:hypothetical protein